MGLFDHDLIGPLVEAERSIEMFDGPSIGTALHCHIPELLLDPPARILDLLGDIARQFSCTSDVYEFPFEPPFPLVPLVPSVLGETQDEGQNHCN